MKKTVFKLTLFTYFFVAGMFLFSNHAYAYIDPSAATYVIQAVAGVVIAIGALLTVFRHKIFAFFKKGKGDVKKREINIVDNNEEKLTEE